MIAAEKKTGNGLPAKERQSAASAKLKEAIGAVLVPLSTFAILFALWELAVAAFDIKAVILPPPTAIFAELFGSFAFFIPHIWTTFYEAVSGFVIGTVVALVAGVLMAQSALLERTFLPVAVLANVTPAVAIAPLFIIWFGFGETPKILLAAISTFFPMLINSITGFRSVDENNYEYLRSLHSNKFEIFLKLRLPNSLPFIFSAARTCMSMSVIGAVVGEMYGGTEGLGNVLTVSANYLQMDRMFASLFLLAAMGILLTNLVKIAERKFLHWHSSAR